MRKLLRMNEIVDFSIKHRGRFILSAVILSTVFAMRAEESHLDFYKKTDPEPVILKTSELKSIVFTDNSKLQINTLLQDNFLNVDPLDLTRIEFSSKPITDSKPDIIADKVTISITPNPVTDSFRINGLTDCNVEVIGISGAIMLKIKNYKGENINTSNLPKGIYIVKADKYTTKLIKK